MAYLPRPNRMAVIRDPVQTWRQAIFTSGRNLKIRANSIQATPIDTKVFAAIQIQPVRGRTTAATALKKSDTRRRKPRARSMPRDRIRFRTQAQMLAPGRVGFAITFQITFRDVWSCPNT